MEDIKTKELLEELHNNKMLYFILVSFVSADTLTSLKACDDAEKSLTDFKTVMPETNIPKEKQESYLESIEKGLEIVKQERERLSATE